MKAEQWYSENLHAISQRLEWMLERPEGIIDDRKSPLHRILITKEDTQIRVRFIDPSSDSATPRFSGIMSRIDLLDPLKLLGLYTQVMMLSLLWRNDPRRVYMLGFGGGRIPMILHHYFPEVIVESTEIDPGMVELAERFFGFLPDTRQKIIIKDGREFLSNRAVDITYDIMLVDAFRGIGFTQYNLGTIEFWELCKEHLSDKGVISLNLIETDPLFNPKINTICASFNQVYIYHCSEAHVVFATDADRLDSIELMSRAKRIEERFQFHFPFSDLVNNLDHVSELSAHLSQIGDSKDLLRDEDASPDLLPDLSKDDAIFYNAGRNDPCPCGSGKKFKKCHGR